MTSLSAHATAAELGEAVRRGLLVGTALLALLLPPAIRSGPASTAGPSNDAPATRVVPAPRYADFSAANDAAPSPEARHVADWIADSGDNDGADFVIVDKAQARIHVFDAQARLRGSTPVLLGAARGDESVPEIGSRPIDDVRPEERTTPAGRFVAERGRNALGEDVVWIDYDAAVSMHRVRTSVPAERRLERLATPTVDDNRISYGCINVPVDFYESFVRPAFAVRRGIVYVLPEHGSVQRVFGSYDVAETHGVARPPPLLTKDTP